MARSFSASVSYLLSGLTGRLGGPARCPACGSGEGEIVDRKWAHALIECASCALLHRYPVEPPETMSDFYQSGYAEPGLTTELPDYSELASLLASGFKGSAKDFSYHGSILRALVPREGARLLDYGANWGYASWQFARHGFDVSSFEISRPRAAYGERLGLKIHTDIKDVGRDFDISYSCHVLEHTPDPAAAIKEQMGLLKPGGLLVAHTPNGSAAFRRRDPKTFGLIWGQAHPVLLTDQFVARVAGTRAYLVTSDDSPRNVAAWNLGTQLMQSAHAAGLFFVIRKPD